jgi:hypothetical protein
MINTKLLQDKMRRNGYTISSLANHLGMSRTGLFNKIHGIREFKISEINSIGIALRLSKADLNRIFFAKNVE